jgi:osmoprotectant transport system permease protein
MIWRTLLILLLPAIVHAQPALTVGSKRFTESYVLGEIVTQRAKTAAEARVVHQQGLGNTGILFSALKSGAIDVYPEYTGTVALELLGRTTVPDLPTLRHELARLGLGISQPLGFNNTYALAMAQSRAEALGIATVSDLARHPALRLGYSQEFLVRKDGWGALKRAYAIPHTHVRGLDHGLAYEALATGSVDVIDVYSTDAKIERYSLKVLADDRGFFPRYDAVLLYRLDLPARLPRTWAALASLENSLSGERMLNLNADVELRGFSFAAAAGRFLGGESAAQSSTSPSKSFSGLLFGQDFGRLTREHMALVFGSLVLSMLAGIPLGIAASRSRRGAQVIFGVVGLLQTIPALALLAFLITLMGSIGTAPALTALFLYALLPIVRNTASGLADIPASLQESARALGLPASERLLRIELPLASRSILAGIKTSAVINVGTATIAAFIGAGGYGERIVAGLAINDNAMMLAGAVPAAALALAVQGAFDLLERRVVPAGLRPSAHT